MKLSLVQLYMPKKQEWEQVFGGAHINLHSKFSKFTKINILVPLKVDSMSSWFSIWSLLLLYSIIMFFIFQPT